MKSTKINLTTLSASMTLAILAAGGAQAVPVNGLYIEDSRCDNVPTQQLTHELGDFQFFPINEAFQVVVSPTTNYICVPDDGIKNDWRVDIRNVSGIPWTDLFFVGDLGMSVGNADGNMVDIINAPGVTTDAFRIDGTVTITGGNDNLTFESMNVNEIFEPFEQWTFYVTNFMDGAGVAPPPLFTTPGVFAGSSFIGPTPYFSTASILANPVPEPASAGLLCLSLMPLLRRRHRS